jgi:hypothetical protein
MIGRQLSHYLIQEKLALRATPEEHQRLAVFDSEHLRPRADTIRETLAWLDRYLGPVETSR